MPRPCLGGVSLVRVFSLAMMVINVAGRLLHYFEARLLYSDSNQTVRRTRCSGSQLPPTWDARRQEAANWIEGPVSSSEEALRLLEELDRREAGVGPWWKFGSGDRFH